MAASTVTIDTGEWNYIDSTGIGHQVTNAQTFSMIVVDADSSDVRYSLADSQTPMTTTDGYKITFRPTVENATNGTGNGNGGNSQVGLITDAGEGSPFYGLRGTWPMVCSVNGVVQNWRCASITPSDADYGAAGTIAIKFEDQFGRSMNIIAGTTVGQAA